jgi:hypothetical protein
VVRILDLAVSDRLPRIVSRAQGVISRAVTALSDYKVSAMLSLYSLRLRDSLILTLDHQGSVMRRGGEERRGKGNDI